MARIAITGSGGFVGTALVQALRAGSQHELPHELITLARKGDASIVGDLNDHALYDRLAAAQPDVVIHLAAVMWMPWHAQFENNVKATATLCEHLPASVKTFIILSSYAVYPANNTLHTETDMLMPDTGYGLSKLLAEEIVRYWCARKHINVVILRAGTIYGLGSHEGAVFSFAEKAPQGSITINGDGSQRRTMVHVDDVVSALRAGITRGLSSSLSSLSSANDADSRVDVAVYNIGAETVSIREIADMFVRRYSCTITFAPADALHPKDLCIDSQKAMRELSWTPARTLAAFVQSLQ